MFLNKYRGFVHKCSQDFSGYRKSEGQLIDLVGVAKKVEPRVGVEPTTCRLRIDCSTTELPRLVLLTIASAENFCQFIRENRVLSTRKGIHRPADAHADEQKKEQRPRDVFHTLDGLPAAQEAESHGNHQREKQHRLQMTQLERDGSDHALRPRAAS